MTFFSALLLGLLASLHCAGMCGGLQSVLQRTHVIRSPGDITRHLLLLNLGRISTYVVMGLIVGALGNSVLRYIDIPQLTQFARTFTAVILLLFGLIIISASIRPFRWLEPFGAGLWRRVATIGNHQNNNAAGGAVRRGLIWGFLPCGLVYGVLLSTLFADSYYSGAFIMLGFGLGTLPSMLLTGGVYVRLRRMISAPTSRWLGGVLFLQAGALMLLAPLFVSSGFMAYYPQVMQQMFCLN